MRQKRLVPQLYVSPNKRLATSPLSFGSLFFTTSQIISLSILKYSCARISRREPIFFPWNAGVFTPDGLRYFFDGFADYFKIPDNCVESPPVIGEFSERLHPNEFLDSFYGFKDIVKINPIVPRHKQFPEGLWGEDAA